MPRYKLTIEYDGSNLSGWQRQEDRPTVQEHLETAFELFTQEPVQVHGAGRTDAGVHALGQVAHVDLPKAYTPFRVSEAMNHFLRDNDTGVCILKAEEVSDNFHARFSATHRRYLYRILNRRAFPALEADRVWWISQQLDVAPMREAAKLLIGHHDFTSFRDSECQAKSPEKTLDRLDIETDGEEILFHVESRSFLHHQVRIIVGTLSIVGSGRWTVEQVQEALDARHRAAAGPTAPACGLYLAEVGYGSD